MKRHPYVTMCEKAGRRPTIGFAGISDFRGIFGHEYMSGAMDAANDYNMNFLNFAGAIKYSLTTDIDFMNHYLKKYRYMNRSVIDGLITWASSLDVFLSYEQIRELHTSLHPLPMVALGVSIIDTIPDVTIKSSEGIELMINHLISSHNCKTIGFVGVQFGQQYQDRLLAWKDSLQKHNLQEDPSTLFIINKIEPKEMHVCLAPLIARLKSNTPTKLDAIVTPSDNIAAYLIEELAKENIFVPKDILITGFNNQFASIHSPCPITTIDLAYYKRGYAAVELLLDRMFSPDLKIGNIYVPTELILRESCGCFEKGVVEAGEITLLKNSDLSLPQKIVKALPDMPALERASLCVAIQNDSTKDEPHEILAWFQLLLITSRRTQKKHAKWQQHIASSVRNLLYSLENLFTPGKIEKIIHQARVLLAVQCSIGEQTTRIDAYRFNNLAKIAISFASATTGQEVLEAIRYYLPELDIPGIMLALGEELNTDIGTLSLELIHPSDKSIQASLPYRISATSFIPHHFFPKNKPWVYVVQVLYHSGMFIGYVLFEAGPINIALYDTVRTLLSHGLYAIYLKEGRIRHKENLLRSELVKSILSSEKVHFSSKSKLNSRQIVTYLIEHLHQMTNLDQMADDLAISKFALIKRSKELTGHTIQTLHEMLKIERAKLMLENPESKIAEIAEKLGFQNQSYFSSVFKKNTGYSPKEWKETLH